jgi:hypothetical protein
MLIGITKMPEGLKPGKTYNIKFKANPALANWNQIPPELGENDPKPPLLFNQKYNLLNQPQAVYIHTELPTQEQIESAKTTSNSISSTSSVTAGTTTTLSILSTILSADSAGVTIKFS